LGFSHSLNFLSENFDDVLHDVMRAVVELAVPAAVLGREDDDVAGALVHVHQVQVDGLFEECQSETSHATVEEAKAIDWCSKSFFLHPHTRSIPARMPRP